MALLDLLEPIYKWIPEIKPPEVQPPLTKKILWSLAALVLFFVMGHITVIGVSATALGQLEQLQIILASKIGSLITVGIGPIVLASIILQLLVGAKILSVDLSNPADKGKFTNMQKLLAIILSFFEAGVYVVSGFLAPEPGMFLWVVLQVAIGSILLMYLDEVVSKYGVGSGIGLFIAGGVASEVIWRLFLPPMQGGLVKGLFFLFIESLTKGQMIQAIITILPFIFSLIVFFVVVFAEGMHVNIPITMGRRGTGGRFPVKLLYVSNIPVILAVALFANVRLWAELAKNTPVLGFLLEKFSIIVIAPYGLVEKIILQGIPPNVFGEMIQSILKLQIIGLGGELIHAFLYLIVLIITCVIFGKFWVEMAGQGPESVADQLQRSGMYIPGFRRDPRIIKKILEKYIPPISILGSAFVGVLAGFADLTGALGSGTGILLTVGIVYRLYEELARAQLMEMHPMLGKLFK